MPGQGSQYAGMGTALYGVDPVFTSTMDEIFSMIGPEGIHSDWLGRWGVEPVALLGHSAGELAAKLWAEGHDLDLEAVRKLWRPAEDLAVTIEG